MTGRLTVTTQIEFDFDALVAARNDVQRTESTEPRAPQRPAEGDATTLTPPSSGPKKQPRS